MQNFGEVMKAQGLESDSAGLALQRYTIYQDSVEAHTNRMTDAWNKLSTTTTDSKSITSIIDLATWILTAVTNMGGLVPLVTTVISLFVILRSTTLLTFGATLVNGIKEIIATFVVLKTAIMSVGTA